MVQLQSYSTLQKISFLKYQNALLETVLKYEG